MFLPSERSMDLLSSDSKAKSCTEVNWKRRIANDFVVVLVESVLDVCVRGDAGVDGVPSTDIDANITGGVVDIEAEKVVIGAAADEASA